MKAAWSSANFEVVPLFRKPEVATGRLILVEEGLAVLRAQTEPFAIISAVGPTRTGKSATLARTFFRGKNENLFQIGNGVTSYTDGVWITNQTLEVSTTEGGSVRVLFMDTEGFSSVSSFTSRTYEANLFGIVYLLSSSVIFNSMFPIDASTISNLNTHAGHALRMVQNLKENGRRRKPRLTWSVQSFNMFALRNSGLEAADLLSVLRNATHPTANEFALRTMIGIGDAKSSSSTWLVDHLFPEQQLVPVRRPHHTDEIVANLDTHDSSELSQDYLDVRGGSSVGGAF